MTYESEQEVCMETVREIIRVLGKPAEEIIHDKISLGNALMAYVFGTDPTKFDRELVHAAVWREVRDTKAATLWLIQCLKKYGMKWVDEKLMPTYDEKTELMATVLGGK